MTSTSRAMVPVPACAASADVREDGADVLAERLARTRRAVADGLEELVVDVYAVHEQVVPSPATLLY